MQDSFSQERRLVKTSTPGIYKRGGRYVVVFRDPHGKQRKRSAKTLAEARDLKAALTADVKRGEFGTLHGWLRENIYRHGAKFTASELVQRVTGGPLSIAPYLDYLWGKYQPLYGLREEERLGAGVA